jgi:hypothetical protein
MAPPPLAPPPTAPPPTAPPRPPAPAGPAADVAAIALPVDTAATVTRDADLGERTPQAPTRQVAPAATPDRGRHYQPGDLICGQCGEGNDHARKFCRRCGTSLVEATVASVRWWRKLAHRRGAKIAKLSDTEQAQPRHRATMTKISRQALRRLYRKVRLSMGIVLALAAIMYGTYPPFRSTVNSDVGSVKQAISKHVDVHFTPERPVRVSANLQLPGHGAPLATDGFTNTSWSAKYSIAKYPVLTLEFGHPVTLERMILNSGVPDDYTSHGRPALIVLLFSNHESTTLTPQDTPKAQTLNIAHAVRVSSVRIEVEGVFSGPAGDVAIANVELFGVG